jgi:hypothetical protein
MTVTVACTRQVTTYKLEHGLYRIHWASGGTSLAAIGITSGGGRWIAPINWVEPSGEFTDWEKIAKLERLIDGYE